MVCLIRALALNIAQTPSILQLANLNTTSLNSVPYPTADWECRSGGTEFLHRPITQDCGLAVLKLPKTDTTGAFHSGGPADDFKLPFVATKGTCSVRIAIVDDWNWQETADWHEVATEAAALWYGCKAAVVESWFVGASTTAGKRGKIGVTFQYSSGNANET